MPDIFDRLAPDSPVPAANQTSPPRRKNIFDRLALDPTAVTLPDQTRTPVPSAAPQPPKDIFDRLAPSVQADADAASIHNMLAPWQAQRETDARRRAEGQIADIRQGRKFQKISDEAGYGYVPDLAGGREPTPEEQKAIYSAHLANDAGLGTGPVDPNDPNGAAQANARLAQQHAKDNNPVQNWTSAAGSGIAHMQSGLIGFVAPKTAARLNQNVDSVYNHDPDTKAAMAGQVFANAVPVIAGLGAASAFPQAAGLINNVVAGGLGASQFGSVRTDVAERRARGENITIGQELTAAALSAAAEFAGEGIGLGAVTQGKRIVNSAGQEVNAYFTNKVAERVMQYARSIGVNAGEEMATQIAQNAVTQKFIDPKQSITEGVGEAGLIGGGVGGIGGIHNLGGGGHGGGQGQQQGTRSSSPVTAQDVASVTPNAEAMAGLITAPPASKADSAAGVNNTPDEMLVKGPTSLETAKVKYRIQEGANSRGVEIQFENANDKALYVATQPRKGKLSAEATRYLESQGLDGLAIKESAARLRTRVEQLAASGIQGDTFRIPADVRLQSEPASGTRVVPTQDAVNGQPGDGVNNTPSQVAVQSAVTEPVALTRTETASAKSEARPASPSPQTAAGESDAFATKAREVRSPLPPLPQDLRGKKNVDIRRWASANGYDTASLAGQGRQRMLRSLETQRSDAGKQSGPPTLRPDQQQGTLFLPSKSQQIAAVKDAGTQVKNFRAVKPPNRDLALASDVFAKRGVKLVYFTGEGRGFRMKRHPGVIFVNADQAGEGLREAISHEFMHELHDSRPGLFQEFREAVPAAERAEFEQWYSQAFEKMRPGEKPAALGEEGVTTPFGLLAKNHDRVWAAALGKNPTLLQKLGDFIRQFTAKFSSKSRQITAAIKAFEATLSVPVGEGNTKQRRAYGADPATFLPSERVRSEAAEYVNSVGLPYRPSTMSTTVNERRAKAIADWYDAAKHSPNDPQVKASYAAMKAETLAQFKFLQDKGVKFEPWTSAGQPYADSKAMLEDVQGNGHLYFFTGGDMPGDHPLAEKAPGTPYTYNDVFRAVHDYFGHAKEGTGFGPRGEENAWVSHSRMYSPEARPAMTAETRGQNSWVNFGPHGEANRANPAETRYAEQKAVIAPPEFVETDNDKTRAAAATLSDTLREQTGQKELAATRDKVNDLSAEQDRQLAERPNFLPRDPAERDAALKALETTKLREVPLNSEPGMFGPTPPKQGSVKGDDVAKILNGWTKKLAGQSKVREGEKLARAIAAGIPEAQYQLQQPNSGKDWYKADIAKMEKTMIGLHPSLAKAENMTLFKAILAITSQGNNPYINLKFAEPIYARFDEAGEILKTQPGGKFWPGSLGENYRLPLGRLEKLVEQKGRKGAAEWLLSKHSVADVNAFSESIGMNGNVSGPKDAQVYGMEMFGPKIGVFALNQHGIQEKITKDMWFSRTWNRWMGTMLENGELVDAPRNDAERETMDKAVAILADKLGMDGSEVQAVLWYYEQQLWKAHGAKAESGSYSRAAERVANGERYDLARALSQGEGESADGVEADADAGGLYGEAGRSGGRSLQPDFLPGGKFLSDDLKPAVISVADGVKTAWDGIKSLILPFKRSPQAQQAALVLRERGAELAQRYDRLEEAFSSAQELFKDKLTTPQARTFIDDMENGRPQSVPSLQPIADAVRAILDDRLGQVRRLGTGKLVSFVTDYFPHIWEDPTKAAKVWTDAVAKAPVEGKKSFLRKRSLPTLADGLARGLVPVTENPIEAMILRVREMDKYITAQQAFKEMRAKGLVKKVRARDVAKFEGYARINDNIATIFAKPSRRGAIQVAGYYIAPEPVANVVNNYLSPGIRGSKYFGKVFRGYLSVGNLMNQVQLGLSFFHVLNTVLDSSTSSFGLGLSRIAKGQFGSGLKELGSAVTFVGPGIQNLYQGNLLMQEWRKPGSTTPQIAMIVDAMKAAGGRVKMDEFYHTGWRESLKKAWHEGNVIGSLFRLPLATLEATAVPVMEKMVPRMKMGVFFRLAQFELEHLPPGATREQVRKAMANAWDSVDNRMGELVYDNLFWNKAVKDIAMASTRSVGWNLGTWRELGGGIRDIGKLGVGLATGGKFGNLELTHKAAYMVAMPAMAGLLGGILHRLLTDKDPEEFKDWFFPKTGQKDKDGKDVRLSLPSYMKDVLAYGENPVSTVANKVHPMLNTIMEMLANRDYYGTAIRNEDDPIVQQALDLAKHAGKSFTPFGIREVLKLQKEGQGVRSLLPLVGVVQARRDITGTKAELLASELAAARMPRGTRTKEEAERAEYTRDLADRVKANDPTVFDEIDSALKSGKLTEASIQKIVDRQRFNAFERTVRHLDVKDAIKVWDVASDKERREMAPFLIPRAMETETLTPPEKDAMMRRLARDWQRLSAKAQEN